MTWNRCKRVALPAVLSIVASTSAVADEALARKSGCLACHAAATQVVGPAYRDVAAKYAGDPGAEEQLVRSIRAGGSGKWGDVPMPPQAALSDRDAHRLAKWILGGAK